MQFPNIIPPLSNHLDCGQEEDVDRGGRGQDGAAEPLRPDRAAHRALRRVLPRDGDGGGAAPDHAQPQEGRPGDQEARADQAKVHLRSISTML